MAHSEHSIDVKIEELSSPAIRHPASAVGIDQDILIPTLHCCYYFKPLTTVAGMQGARQAHGSLCSPNHRMCWYCSRYGSCLICQLEELNVTPLDTPSLMYPSMKITISRMFELVEWENSIISGRCMLWGWLQGAGWQTTDKWWLPRQQLVRSTHSA